MLMIVIRACNYWTHACKHKHVTAQLMQDRHLWQQLVTSEPCILYTRHMRYSVYLWDGSGHMVSHIIYKIRNNTGIHRIQQKKNELQILHRRRCMIYTYTACTPIRYGVRSSRMIYIYCLYTYTVWREKYPHDICIYCLHTYTAWREK